MDLTQEIKKLVTYIDTYGPAFLVQALWHFPGLSEADIRRAAGVLGSPLRLTTRLQGTLVSTTP